MQLEFYSEFGPPYPFSPTERSQDGPKCWHLEYPMVIIQIREQRTMRLAHLVVAEAAGETNETRYGWMGMRVLNQ